MIIVELSGGLGNQMFQYAIGRTLSLKYKVELKLDLNRLLDRSPRKNFIFRDYDLSIFNIVEDFANKDEINNLKFYYTGGFFDKLINKFIYRKSSHVLEDSLNYNPKYLDIPDNSYLSGYFQSENYFINSLETIKQDFTLKSNPSEKVLSLESEIMNSNSIAINVRRTDFVLNNFHGTCEIDYFSKAVSLILNYIQNPTFYIFSDDLDWCKNNLRFNSKIIFVEHKYYAGSKFEDYFRLMKSCKNFIIPNSSFAWWAAYLSENNKKIVITPKKWNNCANYNSDSIIPKNWLKV